ncbi:MAG: ABC transporter permease [Bryobacteraceae bacterium]|nr:ABC transporter permease [Bryobacteraceae bacterium]
MLVEIGKQAWDALKRDPTRSFLTMAGIVWGIVTVTLLIAYGNGFRSAMVLAFDSFGKSAVIAWPGQTSEQAGGERAGKRIRFEQADVDLIRSEDSLVKYACLETISRPVLTYNERKAGAAVRGVCPEYGEIRNEVANEGRWITAEDSLERRRVAVLGNRIRQKLFSGRPAVGETITIQGVRFTVIGTMENKIQFSNYFSSDDESVFIPYSAAGDLWNTKYGTVMVFSSVSAAFEARAIEQVRATLGKRQGFNPTDKRAMQMFGRQEFRPIIDGITIGLQVLLLFVGVLTLGIGGVGVMNIMLVSVNERVREIGLRMALGARRRHIRAQFLLEALALTIAGGVVGIALAYGIAAAIGSMPLLGPMFEDESGKGDLRLRIDAATVATSTLVLLLTGVLSGLLPAMRASGLDPTEALRYE